MNQITATNEFSERSKVSCDSSVDLVIYAFAYPADFEAARRGERMEVKVGDTTQGIAAGLSIDECAWQRMNQQRGTTDTQKKILIGSWGIDTSRGVVRDKTLHKIFQQQGRQPRSLRQGSATE